MQSVLSSRRDRTVRNKKRRRARRKVLGKDVSVAQSASPGQVIYGRIITGGVYTFLETSSDSHAWLVTGSGNSQLAWQAVNGGASGNNILIELYATGTVADSSVVVDGLGPTVRVRLKSSGGTSTATAQEIINLIRGNVSASAVVRINQGAGDATGVVSPAGPTALTEGGGTWLHQFITLACHVITEVVGLHLDNRGVTFGASPDTRWGTGIWANKVFMAVQGGSASQVAQPDLQAQLPSKWTADHRQRECAGVYIITVKDQNVFAEGFPEATFEIKGRVCYDPRLNGGAGGEAWTQNAALIIADFLSAAKFGLGIPYAEIDSATLTAAANTCDESVGLVGGGTEARYTINCYFDTDLSPAEVLQEMAQSIAGDIVYQNGKWYIYPGTWRASSMAITEDDYLGPPEIVTNVSRSDSFNSVRGGFVDPGSTYNAKDYPVVKNDTYITQDGAQVWEDISFAFVTSHTQCQRIAKIELERVRQGITVLVPMTLKALQLQVCDTVTLTDARFGWTAKAFEVRDLTLEEEPSGAMRVLVLLRETASAIYDWANGAETVLDLSPNTTLPSASDVSAPTGVTLTSGTSELYFRQDGTVFSRLKVSWDSSTSIYVQQGGFFEIQYKRSTSTVYTQSFFVMGDQTFHHILDVEDGLSYDVRIRARNSIQYYSDWVEVTGHIVVGKTAPPSNVTGFAAVATDIGIQLSWLPISDIDVSRYEVRQGFTWASGAVVASITADTTSVLYPQLTAGSYLFHIKAIDTSGNYSANEATRAIGIQSPNPVTSLTAHAVQNTILIDWQDSPVTTLSVNKFEVYKGAAFSSAIRIGVVFGTFMTYLESEGGSFTYWVVAVDVGGNRSTEVSVPLTVQPFDDYYIVDDINPFIDGTLEDRLFCAIGGEAEAPLETEGDLFFPVGRRVLGTPSLTPPAWEDEDQTWEEWFDEAGFTTLQDYIDAGYDAPLAPNPHWPGFVEYSYDLGVVLPNTFIDFTWTAETWGETPESLISIVPTISVSEDDVLYTDYVGAAQVFAADFRYVHFRLDFQAYDDKAFARITNQRARFQVQEDEELGESAVLAADSGGTTITLTKSFLYVTNIQCTAAGTTYGVAVADRPTGINPTTFKILLFDAAGNRINGTVAWRARGPLNPS